MITVKNLSKSYIINGKKYHVLKNINFHLDDGESLAILGRNGAGKSTLLNILSGIDKPDKGEILTNSKISWPVGLSSGFQGSLTGRENVIFVAKVFNNEKKQINQKIKFVKDFSDLGIYFNKPIKTYSAGMRARLSFALSIAFEFDLYLFDEVTAAGDNNFRIKCKETLDKLNKKSSFIYVTHNLGEITSYFEKGGVIYNGSLIVFENIQEAVNTHQKLMKGGLL